MRYRMRGLQFHALDLDGVDASILVLSLQALAYIISEQDRDGIDLKRK